MSKNLKYPSCTLESALEYAKKIYSNLGSNSIDTDSFLKAMGYGGRSGASMSTLASLKYFGLAEGRGEDIKLSELFMKIARPLDEREKLSAIFEASRMPDLYSKLAQEFEPLPSTDVLKSVLIRHYGISEKSAEKVTYNFLKTVEFGGEKPLESDKNRVETDERFFDSATDRIEALTGSYIDQNATPVLPTQLTSDILRFKLSSESSALIEFYGPVNAKIIQRLIKHLELTKLMYEEEADD